MLLIQRFLLLALFVGRNGNHHRLLDKMSGVDNRVYMQLFVVLDFLNPLVVLFCSRVSSEVRIASAVLDPMPDLFAANTPDIPQHLLLVCSCSPVLLVVFLVLF